MVACNIVDSWSPKGNQLQRSTLVPKTIVGGDLCTSPLGQVNMYVLAGYESIGNLYYHSPGRPEQIINVSVCIWNRNGKIKKNYKTKY